MADEKIGLMYSGAEAMESSNTKEREVCSKEGFDESKKIELEQSGETDAGVMESTSTTGKEEASSNEGVDVGVAHIKEKYTLPKRPRLDSDNSELPPQKKSRGQNKYRPPVKIPFSSQLCPSFHIGSHKKCSFGDKCRYLHDVQKFLQGKLPDINETCYVFETFGICPSGLACRYGNSHIDPIEGKSIVNERECKSNSSPNSVMNTIPRTLQEDLRKKRIKFPRSDAYLASIRESNSANNNSKLPTRDSTNDTTGEGNSSAIQDCVSSQGSIADTGSLCPLGPVMDEDSIKLRPSEKKKIDFKDKLYLAPLTTVGNLPFRRICKKYGADITCSEMALCTNLLQGQQSEWALMKRHESEDLFGIQVCGSFPDTMSKCAELISNKCSVDFIDINTGCPIDLIFKKGAGCALMQRKTKFQQIVTGMSQVIDIPLTVKMRTGVYDKNWNAHKIVPLLKEWGASLVTIHGRSREQRYTKLADWSYIDTCAREAGPMPVFGNGDILSFEDYNMYREHSPHVSGTMIARGALIKPWIFTEIKEQRHWDISSSERLSIVKDYVNFGLEHWGSDTQGVERVRRFLLEWLSFLHRYIPYGLLERTQKLNERPPYFVGRDDMETLMASRNCQDWIKISEMFLGPVPDSFSFLPKHKANSYS